ncbi:MAG TPA: hypothetical protein VF278_06390 [Pirellulales bacterium]
MNYELYYTSAPHGLKPGSSGFCTVKATCGMPVPLRELLESLSHYRHVYAPHDNRAAKNPISCASVTATLGGASWHILSRIQPAGLDHTKRGNFFAHHLAIHAAAAKRSSPTAIFSRPGLLAQVWDNRVEELPAGPVLPPHQEVPRVCRGWAAIAGDAGWAGAVAQLVANQQKVYVVFEPGTLVLPLVSEVVSLLPNGQQWQATFCTYFSSMSQLVDCKLRFVLASSDEHRAAVSSGARVIDLTSKLGPPDGGSLVEVARTGQLATSSGASGAPAPPGKAAQAFEDPRHATGAAARGGGQRAASAGDAIGFRTKPVVERRGSKAAALAVALAAGALAACLVLAPLMFSWRGELSQAQERIVKLTAENKQIATDLSAAGAALTASEAKFLQEENNRKKYQQEVSSWREKNNELVAQLNTPTVAADVDAAADDVLGDQPQMPPTLESLTRENKTLKKDNETLAQRVRTAEAKAGDATFKETAAHDAKTPSKAEHEPYLPDWKRGEKDNDVDRTVHKLFRLDKAPDAVSLHDPENEYSLQQSPDQSSRYQLRGAPGHFIVAKNEKTNVCDINFAWEKASGFKPSELDDVREALMRCTLEFQLDDRSVVLRPLYKIKPKTPEKLE